MGVPLWCTDTPRSRGVGVLLFLPDTSCGAAIHFRRDHASSQQALSMESATTLHCLSALWFRPATIIGIAKCTGIHQKLLVGLAATSYTSLCDYPDLLLLSLHTR